MNLYFSLKTPNGIDADLRKNTIGTINQLNKLQYDQHDPETLTRIAQYEMANRMQKVAPQGDGS